MDRVAKVGDAGPTGGHGFESISSGLPHQGRVAGRGSRHSCGSIGCGVRVALGSLGMAGSHAGVHAARHVRRACLRNAWEIGRQGRQQHATAIPLVASPCQVTFCATPSFSLGGVFVGVGLRSWLVPQPAGHQVPSPPKGYLCTFAAWRAASTTVVHRGIIASRTPRRTHHRTYINYFSSFK